MSPVVSSLWHWHLKQELEQLQAQTSSHCLQPHRRCFLWMARKRPAEHVPRAVSEAIVWGGRDQWNHMQGHQHHHRHHHRTCNTSSEHYPGSLFWNQRPLHLLVLPSGTARDWTGGCTKTHQTLRQSYDEPPQHRGPHGPSRPCTCQSRSDHRRETKPAPSQNLAPCALPPRRRP